LGFEPGEFAVPAGEEAEGSGGSVTVGDASLGGARFEVRIPTA
jgi:hypothetical protein